MKASAKIIRICQGIEKMTLTVAHKKYLSHHNHKQTLKVTFLHLKTLPLEESCKNQRPT